jgi:hypothetical protein
MALQPWLERAVPAAFAAGGPLTSNLDLQLLAVLRGGVSWRTTCATSGDSFRSFGTPAMGLP